MAEQKRIPIPSPEWDATTGIYRRAMRLTAEINKLGVDDAAKVRALFSALTGQEVDESFSLVPPFYTSGGRDIRVGRKVFINQCCTIYDMGGVSIGGGDRSHRLARPGRANHELVPRRRTTLQCRAGNSLQHLQRPLGQS